MLPLQGIKSDEKLLLLYIYKSGTTIIISNLFLFVSEIWQWELAYKTFRKDWPSVYLCKLPDVQSGKAFGKHITYTYM